MQKIDITTTDTLNLSLKNIEHINICNQITASTLNLTLEETKEYDIKSIVKFIKLNENTDQFDGIEVDYAIANDHFLSFDKVFDLMQLIMMIRDANGVNHFTYNLASRIIGDDIFRLLFILRREIKYGSYIEKNEIEKIRKVFVRVLENFHPCVFEFIDQAFINLNVFENLKRQSENVINNQNLEVLNETISVFFVILARKGCSHFIDFIISMNCPIIANIFLKFKKDQYSKVHYKEGLSYTLNFLEYDRMCDYIGYFMYNTNRYKDFNYREIILRNILSFIEYKKYNSLYNLLCKLAKYSSEETLAICSMVHMIPFDDIKFFAESESYTEIVALSLFSENNTLILETIFTEDRIKKVYESIICNFKSQINMDLLICLSKVSKYYHDDEPIVPIEIDDLEMMF